MTEGQGSQSVRNCVTMAIPVELQKQVSTFLQWSPIVLLQAAGTEQKQMRGADVSNAETAARTS